MGLPASYETVCDSIDGIESHEKSVLHTWGTSQNVSYPKACARKTKIAVNQSGLITSVGIGKEATDMIPRANWWATNQAGIHREVTHMSYFQHVGTGKHGPTFAPNVEICHL